MKTVIILLISVLIAPKVSAQTPEIERLLKKAEQTSGNEKILVLADVCKNFYSIDPHKGIAYGEQALKLAGLLKIPSAKSKVYNNLGLNYWALADLKTARTYFDSALNNAVIFKDSLQMAIFYNRMGLIYESLGNFDSSLLVFEKELTIYKQIKDDVRTGISIENIGTIHLKRGEYKSAIIYLMDAKNIFEKANSTNYLPYIYLKLGQIYSVTKDYAIAEQWFQKGIDQSLAVNDLLKAGLGLNAMGLLYINQGRLDSALVKFREGLEITKGLNNLNLTKVIYDNIGNVHALRENFENALNYHQKSNDLALQMKNPIALAINQVCLGKDYFGLKDYTNARIHFEEALPVFLSSKSKSDLLRTYEALVGVNNALGDFKQSVRYYQSFIELKDSLYRMELNTALDSLKVKFYTEETERENLSLMQEAKLQTKTISLQRIIMVSSFILLVLLITLAIVIIKSRQKINKANELLGIKNLDISAKAEELRISNERLLEMSKFKDSMNSFLVHDLKNPLNAIINFDPRQFSEHQSEALKHSGKQMLNIVMNLLDISAYETKTMKISAGSISLTEIINKAYTDIEYLAEQKNIRLKSDYPTDFIVQIDPEIIERVFVNLFSNAIKFSSTGDTITVFAEQVNQTSLKVVVKDNGIGIPAEHLPIVFDKFTRIQRKTLGVTRSTGIGLTFCKMAVEAHAGEIGVDSVDGHGALFWFTLPLTKFEEELMIHPLQVVEKTDAPVIPHLSVEEINLLLPYCDRLKLLRINQISDVKDIISAMDIQESVPISTWKSALLTALSECNAVKYHALINLHSDVKL